MKPLMRVAFLDPHDVSRHGIVAILEKAVSEVQIIESLTNRLELEQSLCQVPWDVLLLDDAFPKIGDVIRVLNYVRLRSPETAIMIISQTLHTAYMKQLVDEGARGFLYKGEQLEDLLLPALRRVFQGELYLSPRAASLYMGGAQPELESLNPRDLQVLKLLRQDLTIREIAEALNLDSQTVYRSRNKLKDVLGVRTNENIVPTAFARGLI